MEVMLFTRFPLYKNVLSQQNINGKNVPIITTPKVITLNIVSIAIM